jgi:hypothetical protein
MNFLSRDILFAICFCLVGFSAGYIVKEQFFTASCPECPPQSVTNLIINNEKIKAKGNGTIDLKSLLQVENKDVKLADSNQKANQETKKRGFLGRIFKKQ